MAKRSEQQHFALFRCLACWQGHHRLLEGESDQFGPTVCVLSAVCEFRVL